MFLYVMWVIGYTYVFDCLTKYINVEFGMAHNNILLNITTHDNLMNCFSSLN